MSASYLALRFLGDEIDRIEKITAEDIRGLPFEDVFFASIPHPDGGSIICGSAAIRRLRETLDLTIDRFGYTRRISGESCLQFLLDSIVDRFYRKGQPVNVSSADRLFADVVKYGRKRLGKRTHFIPCRITHDEKPSEFSIGRVRFQRREACLARLEGAFEVYERDEHERPSSLLKSALKSMKNFDWIAEVTIDDADPDWSKKVANELVDAALNFLHILIGARHTRHLRAGGASPAVGTSAYLTAADGKLVDVGVTHHWFGRSFGDGWWDYLNKIGGAHALPIVGEVLEQLQRPAPAPLAARLLDAAHWFGDAARETFPASQVVKFVTAIERIVVTEKTQDLTQIVVSRGAAMNCTSTERDLAVEQKRFARVYDARSNFVHGSKSPFDKKFTSAVIDAEDLSRSLIWSALYFFGQDHRVSDDAMTPRRLSKGFDEVVKRANELAAKSIDP